MKKKELNELKKKTATELSAELSKKQEEKLKAEVALASGKESNLRAAKNIRRDIAQILTLLRSDIIRTSEGQALEKKGDTNK